MISRWQLKVNEACWSVRTPTCYLIDLSCTSLIYIGWSCSPCWLVISHNIGSINSLDLKYAVDFLAFESIYLDLCFYDSFVGCNLPFLCWTIGQWLTCHLLRDQVAYGRWLVHEYIVILELDLCDYSIVNNPK